MTEAIQTRVRVPLLLLRLGVFIVLLMWTLDKLLNPGHAGGVFENFYGLGQFQGLLMQVLGVLELALILAFVAGLWKFWTYGAVLVLHGISTLASYAQYLDPWSHLLFFAAWPMLAACIALFLLRDLDTLWTLGPRRQ